MKVTVVIPAYNEAQYLQRCLDCLGLQTLKRSDYEVIVVDNGSTDGTPLIVEAAARTATFPMRLLSKPKTSISAVRNFGAAHSQSEILAFLDADCLPEPGWLEQAIRLAPTSGAWGAHYHIPEDATWVGQTWFNYQAKVTAGPATYLPGGDIFIFRRDFEAIGGFNENARTSEDVELCARIRAAGMPVTAMPELAVVHLGTPRTVGRFYRQHRWHGQEVLRLFLRNLPSTKNLPLVVLSAYTCVMAMLVPLGAVVSVVTHSVCPTLVPLALLLLPPLLIALSKGMRSRSFASLGRLWALYLVYFLARAASLRYVVVSATDGGRVKT